MDHSKLENEWIDFEPCVIFDLTRIKDAVVFGISRIFAPVAPAPNAHGTPAPTAALHPYGSLALLLLLLLPQMKKPLLLHPWLKPCMTLAHCFSCPHYSPTSWHFPCTHCSSDAPAATSAPTMLKHGDAASSDSERSILRPLRISVNSALSGKVIISEQWN